MPAPATKELVANLRGMSGWVWRVVEAQHYAQTRQLVATHSDQERLEELLEDSKPPYRPGTEHLDYLLKTPFRYQPARDRGSRFRPPFAGYGAFYASEHQRTAIAEFAYHRYRFLEASQGTEYPQTELALTVFAAGYSTPAGVDLTQAPLDRERALWTHPTDYTATQQVGEAAAGVGAGAIRYEAVRDPTPGADGKGAGRNVAIIDPAAFDPAHHATPQSWHLYLGSIEANVRRAAATPAEQYDFPRNQLIGPET